MVRQTKNHGWDVQEPGEFNYHETFDNLVDEIDGEVIIKGPIDSQPAAGEIGRWFLSTDELDPNIYYDNGAEWKAVASVPELPDNVPLTDEDVEITGTWSFDRTLHADISGNANHADQAFIADEAENAHHLGNLPIEEFFRRNISHSVEEEWEFREEQEFSEGLNVQGGVLKLPKYTNGDPSNRGNQPCIWFRDDLQPS